ncbi:MAG: hypothetical protein QXP71_04900 [Desulfurococcaceae archaeon]
MNPINLIVQHIYRSLFLTKQTTLRKTNLFVKIIFIISTIYCYVISLDKPLLLIHIITVLVILSLIDRGLEWIFSVIIVSIIPGLWFSLTTLLLKLTGFIEIDLSTIFMIFIRTIIVTYTIIFCFSIIDPVEVYNLLIRIGLNKYAVIVLLIYRLTPYGLNSFIESLNISRLKEEDIKSRLAPAVASIIETASYINEYGYFKIHCSPRYVIETLLNRFYSIVLLIIFIINISATLLFP